MSVKKLAYIVNLENMLNTYDELEQYDDDTIETFGRTVSELVDDIIVKLDRLVSSKITLTNRNVLIANYQSMTDPHYWLNHKLMTDLPKASSKALGKKIRQMVNLMNALVVKVFEQDDSYQEEFFNKIKRSYDACQYTRYDLWRVRHKNPTIMDYKHFQAELTADMLIMGILNYDDDAYDYEVTEVRFDLLKKELKRNKKLPENFDEECAKLRRYSYWAMDMFMIDYPKIKGYLFRVINKLTTEQRIGLYNYEVQMKKLHEDMAALNPELAGYLIKEPEHKHFAIVKEMADMLQRRWFMDVRTSPKYDYIWIDQFLNDFMSSKQGEVFAKLWKRENKRPILKAIIVGVLKIADVINDVFSNLGRAIIMGGQQERKNFASYMSLWKDEKYRPFSSWIIDYVKGNPQ